MKKISILLIFIFICGCSTTINENKISLKEQQRQEDIKTCKYYGFKEQTKDFSNCFSDDFNLPPIIAYQCWGNGWPKEWDQNLDY